MLLSILKENITQKYSVENFDYKSIEKVKEFTHDDLYFELIIEVSNGGYFFNNSLHLYGYGTKFDYHNIIVINNILKNEYGKIFEGLFSFGEDIFGNQFVFSQKGILFLNIETGNTEFLSVSFSEWLDVLNTDISYYTGKNLGNYLKNPFGERLCPKKPFVIGGDYSIENLYSLGYPEYIKLNAYIARQIYGLPDGTIINIKTKE